MHEKIVRAEFEGRDRLPGVGLGEDDHRQVAHARAGMAQDQQGIGAREIGADHQAIAGQAGGGGLKILRRDRFQMIRRRMAGEKSGELGLAPFRDDPRAGRATAWRGSEPDPRVGWLACTRRMICGS